MQTNLQLKPIFSVYFFVQSVPFTRAVIEGRTSLGGSESACLGLASALSKLGHDVHIFATQLRLDDADPTEYAGVQWHPAETLFETLAFAPPDVFCALRSPEPFQLQTGAALNLLWNQDLLHQVEQVSGALPALDALVYVSEFHRQQWTGVDEKVIGPMPCMITRNGIDEKLIAEGSREAIGDSGATEPMVVRRPHQFVHISRPERALGPLLSMWPAIRARIPDAELHLCRYDSMYDAGGWHRVCEQYDRETERMQAQVGGIVMHGQLNKVALYQLLHESSLMLYPGVVDFGETSGIACTEAQACGSVFIGSFKGALPETLGPDAGLLLDGDASMPEYQARFVEAVCSLAADPARQEAMRMAGLAHVLPAYTFDVLAGEWTTWIADTFTRRYEQNKLKVLRQLLHWDNHVAARLVAREIGGPGCTEAEVREASDADALCARVIAQEESTAEDYAKYALPTEVELQTSERINQMADTIAALRPATVLDIACGNGAMIVALCRRLPDVQITGYDFSPGVIETAWAAVRDAGFASRVELRCGDWTEVRGRADVVFLGEFLEHVEFPHLVINRLEQHCKPGGRLFLTTPCGPYRDLLHYSIPLKRSHTHAYTIDDVRQLFGAKPEVSWGYLRQGYSARGSAVGVWLIAWAPGGPPAPPLDYAHTILTARPYARVVAAMIVKNAEDWIRKCLASIHPVVDDIVVVDTAGPTRDKACDIAREYGAHIFPFTWCDDFAAARNESLRIASEQFHADWVLWIDADEHLVRAEQLRKYLVGRTPYLAYVIQQNHLLLDGDRFSDKPCRLFKTGVGIQFWGQIHEQPATGLDEGIFPALDTAELSIVHYGYETERMRRGKLLDRNLNLLKKELAGPQPRELAWVLLVRELVTLAGYEGADKPQQQTPMQRAKAQAYLRMALKVYREHGFDDPAHKLHQLIVGSYMLALKWLGIGVEIEWAFAAAPGALRGHPRPERIRVMDAAEGERLTTYKIRDWTKQLQPRPFVCTPWVGARPADIVEVPMEPLMPPPPDTTGAAYPSPFVAHGGEDITGITADTEARLSAAVMGAWLDPRPVREGEGGVG